MPNNRQIAQLLRNVAAALEIKQAGRFRILAYEKAADSIDNLTSELEDINRAGELENVPGIGKTIAAHIRELLAQGEVEHFRSIFSGIPPAVFELLLVPGIGAKRAYYLAKEFRLAGANAVKQLKRVAQAGRIAGLPGWGEKSQMALIRSINAYEKGQIKEKRMSIVFADRIAGEITDYLKELKEVERVDTLGSLRRQLSTIGDIDLAVATRQPGKVIEAFIKYPKVRQVVDQGGKGATVRLSVGTLVDMRVADPSAYGSMLQYFTGSKSHNVRLREYALKRQLSLSEYGIKKIKSGVKLKYGRFNRQAGIYEYTNEKDFYAELGLSYIPPQIREDRGEIESAQARHLPELVDISNIRGDLHIHTDFNIEPSHDLGVSDISQYLEKAKNFGYEYIGISDHNPAVSGHTPEKIYQIMKRRREYYEHILNSFNSRVKKRVNLIYMLEIDIDPEGNLALPQASFSHIDAAIVSVHSAFKLSREDMTSRILRGLSHPKARILGHPTGRQIGSREGIAVDWQKIFEYCRQNRKALEINCSPDRLDLPDTLVVEAVRQSVKLVINTDSHAAEQMSGMKYGIEVAKRGWASAGDILNCMSYNEIINWLKY